MCFVTNVGFSHCVPSLPLEWAWTAAKARTLPVSVGVSGVFLHFEYSITSGLSAFRLGRAVAAIMFRTFERTKHQKGVTTESAESTTARRPTCHCTLSRAMTAVVAAFA